MRLTLYKKRWGLKANRYPPIANWFSSAIGFHCQLPIAFCLLLLTYSCKDKENTSTSQTKVHADVYTCSMHPEIIRDTPGQCPVCGMDLIKKASDHKMDAVNHEKKSINANLTTLLRPTNAFVVSSIPVTTLQQSDAQIEVAALGLVAYDNRQAGIISARYAGRIEKLYVRYQFQKVVKGQKIMDIYSPELLTAQQNMLFVLQNDAANTSLINASKQRLLLMGMNTQQLSQLINSGKPSLTVSVYSNYSGSIRENTGANTMTATPAATMQNASLTTEELALKEGMYIQKGQAVFQVYNTNKVWAAINIYAEMQSLIKVGNPVMIIPETAPHKKFRGTIGFIEPFFQQGSKTLTARVYFDNSTMQIPVGSQVKATVFGNNINATWLPAGAVVSLGLDKIVFIKQPGGFKAHKVATGLSYQNKIQVTQGLNPKDTVAQNAQYLMDSESFIKVEKEQ